MYETKNCVLSIFGSCYICNMFGPPLHFDIHNTYTTQQDDNYDIHSTLSHHMIFVYDLSLFQRVLRYALWLWNNKID